MSSGRRLGDVWHHFERSSCKKGFQGKCTHCGSVILGKKELLYRHLSSCPLVEDSVKDEAREEMKRTEKKRTVLEELSQPSQQLSDASQVVPPAKVSKGNQMKFVVRSIPEVNKNQQEQLDAQLTRFVVSANIPFQVYIGRVCHMVCTGVCPST